MNRYEQEVMPKVMQEIATLMDVESAVMETFDVPIDAPAELEPTW